VTYGDLLVILLSGLFGCVLGAVIGLTLATWHCEPCA
jgi:hypothetical protein